MRVTTVLLLTFLLLLAVPAQAQPGTDSGQTQGTGPDTPDPHLLYLKAGTFDPLTDPLPGPSWLHSRSTHPHYLVQFDGPLRDATLRKVASLDIMLLQYLPDHAFFARVPKGTLDDLRDLPHVRYVGPIHPAFRIHPGIHDQLRSDGAMDISIMTWDASRSNTIAALVRADGGRVILLDDDLVVVNMRLSAVPALVAEAALAIRWVEPWTLPQLANDNDARTARARQSSDGSYVGTGHALWSYNPTTDEFEGFTGANVTVTVADTGLDTTHPAFSGRIVEYFDYGNDGEKDNSGHGTHVAGTVLGDGSWRTSDMGQDGKYAGLAPEAKLVVQEVFVAGNPGANGMGRDAENQGATISSNSWISGYFGDYNGACEAYDRLTHDANNVKTGDQPIFYVFGAGNDGPNAGTIRPPSLAKNVLSVGATGNDKLGSTSDTMVGFSSRGPVEDGRIKPDIVIPGHWVASARSMDSGAHGGWSRPADGQTSYVYGSGTSMATPGAAGAAAVVTQYFRDELDHEPSPALIKAALINGAVPLSNYEYPGMDQGWGRIDLEKSLLETSTYRIYREDQELEMDTEPGNDEHSIWFLVDSDQPFKVTLVWSDVPGTVNSAKHLINDLDLELVDPDGNKYSGNLFENGVSVTNVSFVPDRTNNVEGVLVTTPKAGLWNLRVMAYNVPTGTQDFALVVSGNVVKGHVDLDVTGLSAAPLEVEEGHLVTVSATARNIGNRDAAGVTYRFEQVDPSGVIRIVDDGLIGDMLAESSKDLQWRVTGIRGLHTFRLTIDPGGGVIESDEANNLLEVDYFFVGFDVEMTTTRASVKADPGELVTFEMTLTNGGNVPDEIGLDLSTLPPGWQGGFVKDSHTLPVGGTGKVILDLLVPANATAGEVANLRATAISSGNNSKTQTLDLTVKVNQVFGLEVAALAGPQNMLPGEDRTLELMVRNTGNGLDVLTISPPDRIPGGWWIELSQGAVEVPLRSETQVQVVLTSPERALAGTSIEFNISVRSSLATLVKEVTYSAEVVHFYDSVVTVVDPITEGDAGAVIDIPLLISNNGNGPVGYSGDINFPDSSWTGGMNIENMTLEGYQEAEAVLSFVVPERAINQSYDFTLVIISTGSEIHLYNFTFSVRQFHDVELSIDFAYTLVTQGETARARLKVENLGNGYEEVSLTADLPDMWTFEFSDGLPTIAPFSEAVIDLLMDTDKDTPGGTHDVDVLAYYGRARSETASASISIDILTRPDLVVLRSDVNMSEPYPYVDMLVRLTAIVSNGGETRATDVFVQLFIDGVPVGQPQYISSIDPGTEEPMTFLWTTNRSGVHEVRIVADYLNDIDEPDEGNNAATLTVDVESIELHTSPGPTLVITLVALATAISLAVMARRRRR